MNSPQQLPQQLIPAAVLLSHLHEHLASVNEAMLNWCLSSESDVNHQLRQHAWLKGQREMLVTLIQYYTPSTESPE